jgi:hypothetical protein
MLGEALIHPYFFILHSALIVLHSLQAERLWQQ